MSLQMSSSFINRRFEKKQLERIKRGDFYILKDPKTQVFAVSQKTENEDISEKIRGLIDRAEVSQIYQCKDSKRFARMIFYIILNDDPRDETDWKSFLEKDLDLDKDKWYIFSRKLIPAPDNINFVRTK